MRTYTLLIPVAAALGTLAMPVSAVAQDEAGASGIPEPTMDTNDDGVADAWDRDGDGRADAWDTTGNGQPDALDNDGDGAPDEPTAASPEG